MTRYRICIAVAAAVLALAGCSGGKERPTANLQLLAAARSGIAARLAGPPQPPRMTRAEVDRLDRPLMETTLEKAGLVAILAVNAERADGGGGTVTVWRSEDAVTVALRNGVLIETRGLGGDVLSTEMQVPDGRAGPAGTGLRVQHVRDDDDRTQPVSLLCSVADLGPETVDILERRYATVHLRERCEVGGGTVVNDYWIDSDRRLMRQSRQWAGPNVGYLGFRRLTD